MNLIEFFNDYYSVFSFLYTLLGVVVGFFISKILPFIKRYRIRKCLSLKKTQCRVILPSYEKKIHNNIDIIQVCPIGDIKAVSNVLDLIHATGLYAHQESIIYESNYNSSFDNFNVFCIGGSLANRYSYDLFQQFFPKFKILASEEKIQTNPNKIPQDHFVSCEAERGFCWGESSDERFIIGDDERYAIIVKLSNQDFNMENHGTVHILFGNGVEGTLAISKYLLCDYKDLYKRVKGEKHYFIAFKLKRSTGLIDTNSFVNLTRIMFS